MALLQRCLRVLRPSNFASGIRRDLGARLPYYCSDWTDAWNYRVLPATVMVFFSNVLPALAFALDLSDKTRQQYGVNEVLLASFLAAALFSIFAAQPICIVGVTGPITVFNFTIYQILPNDIRQRYYLEFMGWVYAWSAGMHIVLAVTNGSNFLRYVTRFSCDIFGLLPCFVYLQYGIQIIARAFSEYPQDEGILTLLVAVLMLVLSFLFDRLSRSNLFHRAIRRFCADYGMPISIIATTAFPHWGKLLRTDLATLPISAAYRPSSDRDWLVRFWILPARWVGIAFPFAIILTILFFFDTTSRRSSHKALNFLYANQPAFTMTLAYLASAPSLPGSSDFQHPMD